MYAEQEENEMKKHDTDHVDVEVDRYEILNKIHKSGNTSHNRTRGRHVSVLEIIKTNG